jgi:hypothetical protein
MTTWSPAPHTLTHIHSQSLSSHLLDVYPRVVVSALDDGQHSILTAVSTTSTCKGCRAATHGLLLLLPRGTAPTTSSWVCKATSSGHVLHNMYTAGNSVSSQ